MLTALARHAADPAVLADRLNAALQAYDYRVADGPAPGRVALQLPGRPPLPWPRGARKLRLRQPMRPAHSMEPAVTALIDAMLDLAPVQAFYDVGANHGYFSFVAATHRSAPEVHAFEMHPAALPPLTALKDAHGLARLHIHHSGLSDAPRGERDIWYSLTRMYEEEPPAEAYRDPWYTRLKFRLQGKPDRERLTHTRVTIDSLDALTARLGLRPGMLKVDVDGYEAKVLPGAMACLEAHRPVLLLELHKSRFLAPHGATRAGVVAPLFALGYEALLLENHRDLPTARVRPVGRDAAEIAREETDFFLFV
ncbi:MAG: FkbM family methyltransferase [Pseudomonadota bacterium]